jgi:hypothetical protein
VRSTAYKLICTLPVNVQKQRTRETKAEASPFARRLRQALGERDQTAVVAEIRRALKMPEDNALQQSISYLFKENSRAQQSQYTPLIADILGVDVLWLAYNIGKPHPKRGEFMDQLRELDRSAVDAFIHLPEHFRTVIGSLISSVETALRKSYQEWETREGAFAAERDKKIKP